MTERVEQWTYLVTSLSGGTASLRGHLTGFGAAQTRDGVPKDVTYAAKQERERLTKPVTLNLGADGRLVSCSATDFSEALVHRLLALRLPPSEVRRNDEWSAPDLARPFAGLMPIDVDLSVLGTARLVELNRTNYNPVRGTAQPAACAKATGQYRGFWGPWMH